jgi:lipid II:glycine glycyltransferase (peptidoglycan interpeptide bridge formation enzyme)
MQAVVVWHAYIVWRKCVVLLYSASQFRTTDQLERARAGRANRWLHWQDMLHFKRSGIERYDWGGIFADESSGERAGINQFKREFGGARVTSYNCTLPRNLRGRAYLTARRVWDRYTRRGA